MKKIFFIFVVFIPISVFSQYVKNDTAYLSPIVIEGFGPEPVLVNSYSHDVALVIDTAKHPVVSTTGPYDGLSELLKKYFTYPEEMIMMGIQGNIYVIFHVKKTGEVTDIKILKGVDKTLDSFVVNMVRKIPVFKPTTAVNSYILPLKFKIENAVTYQKKLAIKGELNGDWKCVKRDLYIMEEYYEPDIETNHLRIQEDSIWYFEYPCKYYGQGWAPNNHVWNSGRNSWFQHDTLVIYEMNYSHGGLRYYLKDTFDQNIVHELLKDSIYLPSLFKQWYVETERPDEIEYGPPVKIKYPFYVPPVFKFDAFDVAGKNLIWLNINGTKRKFRIKDCSLYLGYLLLESYEWREQPITIFYFDQKREYTREGFRK